MGLESATYVSDFVDTNPASSDVRSQGDDHLRLIKDVLQNTFPNADKAFYFPDFAAKTADFSVVSTDLHKTFTIDTTAGEVTATLPSLAASDDGWTCSFIKINAGTNSAFIAPASGTLTSGEVSGLANARRCVPGKRTTAIWTGTAWFLTRAVDVPIGSCIEFHGASLPVGFEWPNGQTLSSASTKYPEFYSVNGSSGVTLDRTGRVAAMKESSATRLTSAVSGIDGATLGAAGGAQSVTIAQANLPNVTLTTTIAAGQGSHTHTLADGNSPRGTGSGSSGVTAGGDHGDSGTSIAAATLPQMTGTTPLGGSGTAVNKVPPLIVTNFILVVE